MPGDISKKNKIELLEKGKTTLHYGNSIDVDITAGKGYKKMLRMKERAVLKERTRVLVDRI
jgi:hypothetical protein